MIRHRLVTLSFIAALAGSAPAQAAEIAFVSKLGGQKDVTVERREASMPVRMQIALEAGDRISAGAKSFVEVKYIADNCEVRVAPGRSLVIGAASPCAGAALDVSEPAAQAATAGDDDPSDVKIVAAQAAAGVAQVTSKTGSITRVNRGEGLVELAIGEDLRDGDTVFAGPGSSVTLYYHEPNCEYLVTEETYLVVTGEAPCRAAAIQDGGGNSSGTVDPALALAAGAAIVGGGALAVIAVSGGGDGGNDNPATPD